MTALLVPNVGAEEGEGAAAPVVGAVVGLWRLLFAADARLLAGSAATWPPSLGDPPASPAFAWLGVPGATAWLNTPEAARAAADVGLGLAGADPDVVGRVHDKAFAQREAARAGLVPGCLADAVDVFEPEMLADADAALRRVRAHARALPPWCAGRFTLKPRFGSSGRGRVAGVADSLDETELRGAFPRLAERGGALFEPWLERSADLSAQLHLAEDGALTLLGTAELLVSRAGVYRGHRGFVDYRGRVVSGLEHDESVREAAVEIGQAAVAAGYHGPCGVDAFVFAGPDGRDVLRPVVELNARFTMGIVATGLIRRAIPRIRETLGLEPGHTRAFHFALEAPSGGWPTAADDALFLPMDSVAPGAVPCLVVARDRPALDRALGR